jgi:hypothetical protein
MRNNQTARHLLSTAILSAAMLLGTAIADPAAAVPVRGKAVIGGKSFDLRHAWIIRGPNHFEPTRIDTYIVMSADDISSELSKCPDVQCAIFTTLKNGLIMTDEGSGGFWVRAVHPELPKEQQLSGRGWTATVNGPDRIAGRLVWEPQGNDPVVLNLEIDATLLKAFPAAVAPTPAPTTKSKTRSRS